MCIRLGNDTLKKKILTKNCKRFGVLSFANRSAASTRVAIAVISLSDDEEDDFDEFGNPISLSEKQKLLIARVQTATPGKSSPRIIGATAVGNELDGGGAVSNSKPRASVDDTMRQQDPRRALELDLGSSTFHAKFYAFLKLEFNEDMLDFVGRARELINAVMFGSAHVTPPEMSLQQLIDTYVVRDAKLELNLPASVADPLRALRDSPPPLPSEKAKSRADIEKWDALRDVYENCMMTLALDAYPRFCRALLSTSQSKRRKLAAVAVNEDARRPQSFQYAEAHHGEAEQMMRRELAQSHSSLFSKSPSSLGVSQTTNTTDIAASGQTARSTATTTAATAAAATGAEPTSNRSKSSNSSGNGKSGKSRSSGSSNNNKNSDDESTSRSATKRKKKRATHHHNDNNDSNDS